MVAITKKEVKAVHRAKVEDRDLQRFIDSVTENLGPLVGNGENHAVSMAELRNAGVVGTNFLGGVENIVGLEIDTSGGEDDLTVPDAVQNLYAVGRFLTIGIGWDDPNGNLTSYAEIWRSTTDNIGTALMIGTTSAEFYDDPVGTDSQYYYWVRIKSDANYYGPFNDTNGTAARTARDPEDTRRALTALPWEASTYYGLFEVVSPTIPLIRNNVKLVLQCTFAGTTGASEPDWSVLSGVGSNYGEGTGIGWITVEAGTAPFVIGTVDGVEVVSITEAVIQDASISTAKIKDLAVESANIKDAAITKAKIGNLAVGTAQIEDGAINNAKIGSLAVTNAMIQNGAVTNAKIGNLAVKNANVDNLAIATGNMQYQAVTIPLGFYAEAAAGFVYSTWTSLAWTPWYTPTGNPVHVHGSIYADFNVGGTVTSWVDVRIFREQSGQNKVLGTWSETFTQVKPATTSNYNYTYKGAASWAGSIQDVPAANVGVRYLVQVRTWGVSGGTKATGLASNRSIVALETKR